MCFENIMISSIDGMNVIYSGREPYSSPRADLIGSSATGHSNRKPVVTFELASE